MPSGRPSGRAVRLAPHAILGDVEGLTARLGALAKVEEVATEFAHKSVAFLHTDFEQAGAADRNLRKVLHAVRQIAGRRQWAAQSNLLWETNNDVSAAR